FATLAIEQDQRVPLTPARSSIAQIEQSLLVLQDDTLDLSIVANAVQVLIGQRLNRGIFPFSDPGDSQFQKKSLARLCRRFSTGSQANFFFAVRPGFRVRRVFISSGESRRADFHSRSRS